MARFRKHLGALVSDAAQVSDLDTRVDTVLSLRRKGRSEDESGRERRN